MGAGAWGTALAMHLAGLGHAVQLCARTRPRPLGVALHPRIAVVPERPAGQLTLLAVPVQHMRAVLTAWRPSTPVVLCMKGIETGTGLMPSEILVELHPGVPWAVLTGPNFAHEVAAGLPAAAVVAGEAELRAEIMPMLASPSFRLYGNDDTVGAQLGGAAKNVIAIAAGTVIGAGLGENARAGLITRGLAEIGRLVVAQGGRAETVAGLSGLGDLMLTCTGGASRNFSLGSALGRGEALADIVLSGVAEGVATAPALVARAQGVDLPVCAAVSALLSGGMSLDLVIASVLARPQRDE